MFLRTATLVIENPLNKQNQVKLKSFFDQVVRMIFLTERIKYAFNLKTISREKNLMLKVAKSLKGQN